MRVRELYTVIVLVIQCQAFENNTSPEGDIDRIGRPYIMDLDVGDLIDSQFHLSRQSEVGWCNIINNRNNNRLVDNMCVFINGSLR